MGPDFMYVDFMGGPVNFSYYGRYKKLVWVVMLGCWVLYVVIYEVYAIEAIGKNMSVGLGDFYVLDS